MSLLRILIIGVLVVSSISFSQTKRVKVGTEKRLDYPAKTYQEGVKLYRTALKTRSKATRKKNYLAAYKKFVSALDWLDKFVKTPSLDPNGKYQNGKDKFFRILFSLNAARMALKASKYKDAGDFFKKLTTSFGSESSQVWYEYGVYLYSQSKKNDARRAFQKSIELGEKDINSSDNKKLSKAKKFIARSYYKMGDMDTPENSKKAIKNYKKAIDYDKNYWQAYLKIGKIAEELKEYNEMLAAYENVLRLLNKKRGGKYIVNSRVRNKQLARATMFKGIALYYTGKLSKATAVLESVPKIKGAKKSDKNSSYYYSGLAYRDLGKKSKALAQFKKAKGSFKRSAEYEVDGLVNADKYSN